MKLKKLLLFILIFLFVLLLSGNVKGYVISEGGVSKYFLPDLPVESDNIESVFLFSSGTNRVYLLQFPEGYFLGYDRVNNIFVLYYEDGTQVPNDFPDLLSFYSTDLDSSGGNLIGLGWYSYTKGGTHGIPADFLENNFEFIYGTAHLYPCLKDYGIVLSLPNGFSWGDDFLLAYSSKYSAITMFYPSQSSSGVFIESNGQARYYELVSSSSNIPFNLYTYNSTDFSWTSQGTNNTTPYCSITNYFFNNKDILNSGDTTTVSLSNTDEIFKNLYGYEVFPSILNSAEDLALGNDDIIVLPRRFSIS